MKNYENCEKLSIIVFILMLFLLLNLNFVFCGEVKIIEINNKTFSIEPLIEEICYENQTTVFNIKNLNYSTGDSSIFFNYTQFLEMNKNILIQKEIQKEIKSYTKTNTGLVFFNKSGNYTLMFELNENKFNWNYNIFCNESYENVGNYSGNYSDDGNETNSDEDGEDVGGDEGEDSEENEDLEPIVPEINCSYYSSFNVNSNKLIYENGEKITIYFNDVNASKYNITYWIEDLTGKEIKNKYTTTNINPKTYTTNIDTVEKILLLKGVLNIENCSIQSFKMVGVKNSEYDELGEEINKIEINNLKYDEINKFVEADIYLEKNSGLKRIVEIYGKNNENKIITNKIKIDLKTKSKINLIAILDVKNYDGELKIVVEGLDMKKEDIIILKNVLVNEEKNSLKLVNVSTKKIYLDDFFSWQVKIEGKGEGFLILNTSNDEFIIEKINFTKAGTYTKDLKAKENINITTYLIQNNILEKISSEIQFIDKKTNMKNTIEFNLSSDKLKLDDFFSTLNKKEDNNSLNKITSNVIKENNEKNIIQYIQNYVWIGILILISFVSIYLVFKKDKFIKDV